MTAERRWQPVPGTLARCGDVEVYVVAVSQPFAWVRTFLETDLTGHIRHVNELAQFTGGVR